jgi:hypothetical protein
VPPLASTEKKKGLSEIMGQKQNENLNIYNIAENELDNANGGTKREAAIGAGSGVGGAALGAGAGFLAGKSSKERSIRATISSKATVAAGKAAQSMGFIR